MVDLAVILAAGMGVRLGPTLDGKPKGLLELGGEPIIERSIKQLISCGIKHIVIVTGYLSQYYDALRDRYSCVQTVRNEQYAVSESMYSLYMARTITKGTFLLLESDLVYDTRALTTLLTFPRPNAVLVVSASGSGDEYWVEADGPRYRRVSREISNMSTVVGEMPGINKVSPVLLEAMIKYGESHFLRTLKLTYEECFNRVAAETEIFYCKIDNLTWSEIDTEMDYLKVKREIYPRLLALEQNAHSPSVPNSEK